MRMVFRSRKVLPHAGRQCGRDRADNPSPFVRRMVKTGLDSDDYCDLEAVSKSAAERNRYAGTGSPVNPIATFYVLSRSQEEVKGELDFVLPVVYT